MTKLVNTYSFSKYSGAGNDFILIDNREKLFPSQDDKLIRSFCHRQQGIGADGLILLETSDLSDARYRIFNADGFEAAMCGNGLRCFAYFLQECGFEKKTFNIETQCGIHHVAIKEKVVEVEITAPFLVEGPFELDQGLFYFIDTGVPHVLCYVDHVTSVNVESLGKAISFHPHFAPERTNVNFCEIIEPQKLALRTFERGVYQETLACGTGATAAALITAHLRKWVSPIDVITRSKEVLMISFSSDWSYVGLTGMAKKIFEGNLLPTF